jgi:hypothetical protein
VTICTNRGNLGWIIQSLAHNAPTRGEPDAGARTALAIVSNIFIVPNEGGSNEETDRCTRLHASGCPAFAQTTVSTSLVFVPAGSHFVECNFVVNASKALTALVSVNEDDATVLANQTVTIAPGLGTSLRKFSSDQYGCLLRVRV